MTKNGTKKQQQTNQKFKKKKKKKKIKTEGRNKITTVTFNKTEMYSVNKLDKTNLQV